jgi:hypothetical protein
MIEKRAVPRQRVFKAGRLEFAGRRLDCTIRNISSVGAAVEVISSSGIPHELVLDVVTRGERYSGHVVWRGRTRIGMRFEHKARA